MADDATKTDLKARLEKLKERREAEKKQNLEAVFEEDRKSKEDPRAEMKKQREKKKLEEVKAKMDAEEKGQDYGRIKSMEKNIEQVDWELKQKEKAQKRAVVGFADYEDVALRKYKRLTKKLKPDLDHYMAQKLEQGEDFYRDVNSLTHGLYDKVDEARLEAMAADVVKQQETRLKAHKHRRYDPNADVDYINDRNRKFNEKVSRAFDPYTREIKANLERGTAL